MRARRKLGVLERQWLDVLEELGLRDPRGVVGKTEIGRAGDDWIRALQDLVDADVITGGDMARLPLDVPLRCRCGPVRGVASNVSPSGGFRFVCCCKDCQAFARFLERLDVLDAAGGTDIFQMPPARVKLTAGTDAVRCLRRSDKGVLRWYADCCRTPIGNTAAGPRFPIVVTWCRSLRR